MAFDDHCLRFLNECVGDLTNKSVLTLGRPHDLTTNPLMTYAENHFRKKGADSVQSLDCSRYDDPDFISDLNLPYCEPFPRKFDLVWDCGTIEHVFDIAECLRNINRLLKPGGIFVACQDLNITGHGFYTIAPELLYKWAVKHMAAFNINCVAFRNRSKAWRRVDFVEWKRNEFFLLTPARYIFSCVKNPNPDFRHIDEAPVQAGPSKCASKLNYWLWETSLAKLEKVCR